MKFRKNAVISLLNNYVQHAILSIEFWKFLPFMRPQRLLTLWPFLLDLLRFESGEKEVKGNGTRNCEMV